MLFSKGGRCVINGELSWDSEWAFSNESFPVQFDDEECRPLYTSPPASKPWVGLTADELNMIGDRMKTWNSHSLTDVYVAIEAKLKEKNT